MWSIIIVYIMRRKIKTKRKICKRDREWVSERERKREDGKQVETWFEKKNDTWKFFVLFSNSWTSFHSLSSLFFLIVFLTYFSLTFPILFKSMQKYWKEERAQIAHSLTDGFLDDESERKKEEEEERKKIRCDVSPRWPASNI